MAQWWTHERVFSRLSLKTQCTLIQSDTDNSTKDISASDWISQSGINFSKTHCLQNYPPDRLTHAQRSFCLLDLTFVLLPHWSGTLLWSFCSVPVRNRLAESLSASLLWFHKHQFHLLITNVLFSGLSTLFYSACSKSTNMFARL